MSRHHPIGTARVVARGHRRRTRARLAMASAVLATALVGAGCSSSSAPSSQSASTTSQPTATTTAASRAAWAKIDTGLSALGPDVGMLVAKVRSDGSCQRIHAVAPSKPRPIASQFKLLVLGALATKIDDGTISWDQKVTVPKVRSMGNEGVKGAMEAAPQDARYTVQHVATMMISISDNTAADMLIHLVGRRAVERQFAKWTSHASLDTPLLTTREMLLLHYSKGLGEKYLATPKKRRAAFLATKVDPLENSAIASGYSTEPRFIDELEWFASPEDLCRSFAGLHALAGKPSLAPLSGVLSKEVFGIDLSSSKWPTVWFKGGSEAGVLTGGWLATDAKGQTYVVEAMVSNPDAALATDSIDDFVKVAQQTFALLG